MFHARDLDFDAFAEILNSGKGELENEFAAIVAVNRIGVAHAGSSGLARLAVECVDIDPVEGGQNGVRVRFLHGDRKGRHYYTRRTSNRRI